MHKQIILVVKWRFKVVVNHPKIKIQNWTTKIGLIIHFLGMTCDGQATTDGWKKRVSF